MVLFSMVLISSNEAFRPRPLLNPPCFISMCHVSHVSHSVISRIHVSSFPKPLLMSIMSISKKITPPNFL